MAGEHRGGARVEHHVVVAGGCRARGEQREGAVGRGGELVVGEARSLRGDRAGALGAVDVVDRSSGRDEERAGPEPDDALRVVPVVSDEHARGVVNVDVRAAIDDAAAAVAARPLVQSARAIGPAGAGAIDRGADDRKVARLAEVGGGVAVAE